jgi:dTDP-4-dehydrorhamnose reductase
MTEPTGSDRWPPVSRLLVIGASGLIGRHVMERARLAGLEVTGTRRNFAVPGLVPLDSCDADAAGRLIASTRPEAVINCSAWSWVDGCEGDPGRARRENAEFPERLARQAAGEGARFVHFSTGYVFNGMGGPYSERDAPDPICVYGRTKLDGERAVLEAAGDAAFIVRTLGVYGEELQRKNFVCQVVDALRAGKRMRVPTDQLGNATYAGEIAVGVLRLLEGGRPGLWNLAGPEPELARSEFALRIARAYGLDERLFDFLPTAQLGQAAPRPLHAGLAIGKAVEELGWHPERWVPCDL